MRVFSAWCASLAVSALVAACGSSENSRSDLGSLDAGGKDVSVAPDAGMLRVDSSAEDAPHFDADGAGADSGSASDSSAATDSSSAPDSSVASDSSSVSDARAPVDSSIVAIDGGALPPLTVVGNHFEDPSGNKVILRGVSLEGLYEQSRDPIGLKGIIDKITNKNDPASASPGWYTHIVRLPVDPSSFQANPTNYLNTILKPAVDYATAAGLYAIVDLHYVDNPYALVSQVNAFWTAVAPIFNGYTNVFYEVFNESSQTDSWAAYKPTMQAWVNLIRSFAPNNIILAGSPAWDQIMGDTATNPLTGTNIAYIVHMYEQHYATASLRAQVEQAAAVHPVLMTEWGFCACSTQPGNGTDLVDSYGASMLTWLEGMNGGWTAWCASNAWLPNMFSPNWTLLVGQSQMGGFVKDWMYAHRNQNSAP